ncbi:heavy metal-binding domain-containing protein [Hymenobacter jejuensis]|uniref:Heavy metal binding domain-containing protein n=1 Tax=Hymenobacter jejuensis TaxID=2502781 RepID=A0A5B7ZZB3_9BACT|nr:heavy metal-binding domain-containing protein [Hymenobacter jejuensis]QDA60187.1 hypothetical protein FHG12_08730 [Hymenobacter jejuensis]
MLANCKPAVAGVLLAAATALAGCNNQPLAEKTSVSSAAKQEASQPVAKPVLAYVCPMGCEGSESNKPGKCPVCEMELVRNPAYKPSTSSDSL